MEDFGVSSLSDPQWFELLEAVLNDGLRRAPWLRAVAQEIIFTAAETRALRREVAKQAFEKGTSELMLSMVDQAAKQLSLDVREGRVRLLAIQAEGRYAVEAGRLAELAMVDDAIKAIEQGKFHPDPMIEPMIEPMRTRRTEDEMYARQEQGRHWREQQIEADRQARLQQMRYGPLPGQKHTWQP